MHDTHYSPHLTHHPILPYPTLPSPQPNPSSYPTLNPHSNLKPIAYSTPTLRYVSPPPVRSLPGVVEVLDNMRTCDKVFQPPRGNRTCFQICQSN